MSLITFNWKRVTVLLVCLVVATIYFLDSFWFFEKNEKSVETVWKQNNNSCANDPFPARTPFKSIKYPTHAWIHTNNLIIFNDIFFRSDGHIVIAGARRDLIKWQIDEKYVNSSSKNEQFDMVNFLKLYVNDVEIKVSWVKRSGEAFGLMIGSATDPSFSHLSVVKVKVTSDWWGKFEVEKLERRLRLPVEKDALSSKMACQTMFKNDNHFLRTWMTYHKKVGFSYFFLFNNGPNNTNFLDELMRDFNVILMDWPFPKYDEFGANNRHESFPRHQSITQTHTLNAYPELEWILFSDLDEFIVPMKVRRMDSYLAGLADDISAVLMGATFFGCPNDETIPYNYSNYLEIMTWRGFEFSTSNGKTIGRVGKLLVIRDHYPVVWLDGYRTHYPHKGELRLNHYRQISWEANRTDCDRSFKFMNDLQLYRIWKDIPTKYPDDYSYVEFNGRLPPIDQSTFESTAKLEERGFWTVLPEERGGNGGLEAQPYSESNHWHLVFRLPPRPVGAAILILWVWRPHTNMYEEFAADSSVGVIMIHQQYALSELRNVVMSQQSLPPGTTPEGLSNTTILINWQDCWKYLAKGGDISISISPHTQYQMYISKGILKVRY